MMVGFVLSYYNLLCYILLLPLRSLSCSNERQRVEPDGKGQGRHQAGYRGDTVIRISSVGKESISSKRVCVTI